MAAVRLKQRNWDPALKLAPVVTGIAIIFPSAEMSNNSLPSCRHFGSCPPVLDTCHFPVALGKEET